MATRSARFVLACLAVTGTACGLSYDPVTRRWYQPEPAIQPAPTPSALAPGDDWFACNDDGASSPPQGGSGDGAPCTFATDCEAQECTGEAFATATPSDWFAASCVAGACDLADACDRTHDKAGAVCTGTLLTGFGDDGGTD